jgi:hypothetical protein
MKKYLFNLSLSLSFFGAVFSVSSTENNIAKNTVLVNSGVELSAFKEKINLAILKVENTNRELWSYNISRYENEEGDISSSIEQYSPQSDEIWSLKKINGKAPTKKQLKKFAKKKQKQSNAEKKDEKQGVNIQLPIRKLINTESLTLVSNDEQYIVMAFNVYLKKLGEDSAGKLQGKLRYHKEKHFIEKITVWNNADFSPMFTANITDFSITFSFLQINDAVLTKQNEMTMSGTFAYFTEINETSLDTFSNYIYQGE